jgi:2-(1,2-epoxy-1,2-dihydrophenyl)acetyl-CoA isomerase
MSFTTLRLDVGDDGVAELVLDRPDDANSVNLTMARDLVEASLAAAGDRRVRAVLIRGEGRMFCGGGDLKSFHAVSDTARPHHLREVTTFLHAAIALLSRSDAPVVGAIHGSAAGAGFSLSTACDLVIAGASARFVVAYTKIALSPDGSASYFLPRIVGLRRAQELALTNRVLSAPEAHEWGLVTRVVADDELLPAARALAAELAAGPTAALGATKRLLRDGWNSSLEEQMARETEVIAQMAATADGRSGMAAFLDKRVPTFDGGRQP